MTHDSEGQHVFMLGKGKKGGRAVEHDAERVSEIIGNMIMLAETSASQIANMSAEAQQFAREYCDAVEAVQEQFLRDRLMTPAMNGELFSGAVDAYGMDRVQRTLAFMCITAEMIDGWSQVFSNADVKLRTVNSDGNGGTFDISSVPDYSMFFGYLAGEYAIRYTKGLKKTNEARDEETRTMLRTLGVSDDKIEAFLAEVRKNADAARSGKIDEDAYNAERARVCDAFAVTMADDMMNYYKKQRGDVANDAEGEGDGPQ